MSGKMDSIQINMPESGTKSGTSTFSWLKNQKQRRVWNFCKEDRDRVIFAFKVGLAVLLVSLLVLFKAPYQVFGPNIIWAILTAVLVFEYTVGATFNRGFNRALGSLLAGILAIAVSQIALCSGHVAEPMIIGLSIFLIAAITSLMKMLPWLVQYEYGLRVILVTYCLIMVSGYRMGNPIRTMIDRLYTLAIGGIISVLVNISVLPIWAGEQLHQEMVNNFNSVADSLEECVNKYLEEGSQKSKFITASIDEFVDEPAYKKCLSTLNSGPKLEALAGSAKWEPPHGRFMQFLYPWSQYVEVGAVLRHCAYDVMTLHSIVHAEIQAPYNLRVVFRSEIQEAANQAAELVRILGRDINNMKATMKNSHINKLHSSTDRLQRSMHLHSYLLITPIFESPSPGKLKTDQTGMLVNYPENNSCPLGQNIPNGIMPLPPEQSMRKQLRRQYSWPFNEVGAFEEDMETTTAELLPRMRTLECTAALSLANFTSSLVEFVARVDHLIEAVDKLSKMAKFKPL